MPTYAFSARDPQGRAVEGTLEADDDRAVILQLRERNLIPTRLAVVTRPASAAEGERSEGRASRFGGGRVGLKALALFCRQLSTMLGAGLSVVVSLQVIGDQSGDRRLMEILRGVVDRIVAGESLSESFRHYVPSIPPILVHMIEAGEAGGILEEVFRRLADQFERDHALNEKVKGALVYPKMVMLMAGGMLVFMVVSILPTFATLFSQLGAELPTLTRIVMNGSTVARRNLVPIVIGAFLLYLAPRILPKVPGMRARLDSLWLRLPVLGDLYLMRSMARFTRTLATLIESGVPILTALRVAERTLDNVVLERAVEKARESVRTGRTLSGPLRENRFFPRMLVEMAAVGEETGALDVMLYKAADFYQQETTSTVERLTALLEPILVLGTASVVGLIIAAVFLPLYQVLGSIQSY